jgi:carboxypeptidase C (cathepsin A)
MLFLLLAALIPPAMAGAEAAKTEKKEEQPCPAPEPEVMLPADLVTTTEFKLQAAEWQLPYQATAGTLPVTLNEDGSECRIFFIGYQAARNKDQTPRPLTFVFNGGPGASSAYLHLGALGPKRVQFHEDGSMPGPPPKLVDNLQTWLRFTDLVFVDPAGTGYSRCRQINRENKEPRKAEAKAWGVKEDLTALAKFIRLYLTRNNRWLSPRYLAGESYGGFRVAALSDLLQTDYDISLNGVVLVSPVLEFALVHGNEFNPLPWVADLPSYAATARHYGKAAGQSGPETDIRKSLEEVEHFAVREFLPALALAETAPLDGRLGGYIGLPAQRLAQLSGRVSSGLFAKELLRDDGLLVSLYDGSVTAIDPEPASPFPPGKDPLLVQLNNLLAAALNSYIREQLRFTTDIPYEILNYDVSKGWNWRSGLDGAQGFAGVAENLKSSMSVNQELRVFIAHGVFDLVTPYFGSVIVAGQMALDPAIAANLSLKVYEGGHMFYTNAKARQRFFADAEQFFTPAAVPAAPGAKRNPD